MTKASRFALKRAAIALVVCGCGRIAFDPLGGADGDAASEPDIDAPPGSVVGTLTADTYVTDVDTIAHGADIQLQCGRPSGSTTERTLLRFSLPASQPVTTAVLRIDMTGKTGIFTTVEVRAVVEPWDEYSATWANRTNVAPWTTSGGTFGATAYATLNMGGTLTWKELDVTQLVNAWIVGTVPNEGLGILSTNTGQPGDVTYPSRESGSRFAQLVIIP